MARMTKLEIATLLAENEHSVKIGMQTVKYWVNSYMREYKLADLTLLLEAATEPNPEKARAIRSQVSISAR